jgi:hypothetical protein
MRRRTFIAAMTAAGFGPSVAFGKPTFDLIETPSFADKVKAGGLPPVGQRIPTAPAIVKELATAAASSIPWLPAPAIRG